ncbi:MAG: thioredoxin domain-containing protein [Myxococcota bacterium]
MARAAAGPGRPALVVLGALAFACGAWGLFLWRELLVFRAGGEVFCPLGDGAACEALWDSAFATAVHESTGLPIAGWGLVWGLTALAVTVGLLRAARPQWMLGALVATAAAGAMALVVLLVVSVGMGALCGDCLVTYALVGAFASVVFATTRSPAGELVRGAAVTLVMAGAAFAVLLYPGLRTPLEAVPELLLPDPAPAGQEPEGLDVRLASFVAALPAADKRALARALRAYSAGSPPAVRPPRDLHGSSTAPVRITDFTDTLCGHCARFHEGVEALKRSLPGDSFSFEERHFPLDAACNRAGPSRGPGVSVRCRAALARICMEGKPNAFDYSGDLFRSQESLTAERVLALAAPYAEPEDLEHCMDSAATLEKLRDDIDWALEHRIRGTPLVLVNGRTVPASPTFLYALILSRGDADHTAFQALTSAEMVER